MDRVRTQPRRKAAAGLPARPLCLILRLVGLTWLVAFPAAAAAQSQPAPTPTDETPLQAPERVDVQPMARDEQIRERLQSILEATGWFEQPGVEVRDGVVFLEGRTDMEEFKTWAGDLARRTQDVAAVVNRIEVVEPSPWSFEPALAGLNDLWRRIVRALPLVAFSLVILVLTIGLAWATTKVARQLLLRRLPPSLLVNVVARGAGIGVLLLGLYVVFYVAGLTNVALTVIGGTGLLGLVLGIAFQDITENFLASILLSLQNPFHSGDLVEIDGVLGFVQALTARATILMTQDGNHVQIPNATVYKAKLWNYTSNPNRRVDFGIGIGFNESTTRAQDVALQVLAEHAAVLKDPEPLVLVDSLGPATVNLCIYFWLDGTAHSLLKVKSSVIRLVKHAFEEAGISMPGEVRELSLPGEVQVRLIESDGGRESAPPRPPAAEPAPAPEAETISTQAEGGLRSEAGEIEEQARHARPPEEGQDLLNPPAAYPPSP